MPNEKKQRRRVTGRDRQVLSRLQDAIFELEFATNWTDARTKNGAAIKRLHAQAHRVFNNYWEELYGDK